LPYSKWQHLDAKAPIAPQGSAALSIIKLDISNPFRLRAHHTSRGGSTKHQQKALIAPHGAAALNISKWDLSNLFRLGAEHTSWQLRATTSGTNRTRTSKQASKQAANLTN
jgi:hypothetical protein